MANGATNVHSQSFLLGQVLVHTSGLAKKSDEPDDGFDSYRGIGQAALQSELKKLSLQVPLAPLTVSNLPENMTTIFEAIGKKYPSPCRELFALSFGIASLHMKDEQHARSTISTLELLAASCGLSQEIDAILGARNDRDRFNRLVADLIISMNKLTPGRPPAVDNASGPNIVIGGDVVNIGGVQNLGEFNDVLANLKSGGREFAVDTLTTAKDSILSSVELSQDAKQELLDVMTQMAKEAQKQKPNRSLLKVLGHGLMRMLRAVPDVSKAITAIDDFLTRTAP